MNTKEIVDLNHAYVIDTYGKQRNLALVKGRGTRVQDADGRIYLDFLSGLAVNALGHCHPAVVDALRNQAETLIHVSNLYYIEPQVRLAEALVSHSFASKCFFCNSGAEANEAAIKLARKWGNTSGKGGRIITFRNSFHGRTLATITATGQEKFQRNFQPLVDGFSYASLNDIESVEELADGRTCAILLELVQAEGGVHVASQGFVDSLRRFCEERDLLLILDEVQTGMGRTGRLFAYEHYNLEPDIVTLAKALGGGVPIGAMLAGPKVADVLQPGDHASTFGGNPLASAAALAVLDVLTSDGFLDTAKGLSDYLLGLLGETAKHHAFIKEVRGLGMLIGIEFDWPVKRVVAGCLERGLIVGTAGENVLRLLPPLIATREDMDEAVSVLRSVLEVQKNENAQA
ncbi:MAG: aspartate aminotransferase family protein [Candidatus Abyssobacteria bacterium SURF_5]|jgi:predicted acetylornithine/succinylornithine family transaminase|uniref:Acetylornithine aminotransferase n=1 Tax=Abyssobacteria bacterium (strain SURF_5) TaxID=2093360 RepID=A0A3A4NT37_ABYX5|nr:MAG: aspartate aminotransferase family protein [Candidatus Abyssubacteria bacterium SURF_5]